MNKQFKKFARDTKAALMKAAKDGNLCALNSVLETFADVSLERSLAEHGLSINVTDGLGNTALLWAVKNNHPKIVQRLLNVKTIDVNQTDKDSNTPLAWAVKIGNPEIVENLLDADASLEGAFKLAFNGSPNQPAIAELFARKIRSNSLLNSPDGEGRTPLMLAVLAEQYDTVKLLLDLGADITAADRKGYTVLNYAIMKGDPKTFKLLLDALEKRVARHIVSKEISQKMLFGHPSP